MTGFDAACCRLCPRACGADRTRGPGFCGSGLLPKVARAALHHWEEPCISGTRGSGTVFFSGCSLQCCFCQNGAISEGNFGREVTVKRLGEIFLELEDQGAHNINLVSGGHHLPWIIQALEETRSRRTIPVVYNTGGYERVEALRQLEGLVDVYLPDLKYADEERGLRYSGVGDYVACATAAILEMYRQTGPVLMGEDGILQRGLIIRHLVLPGGRADSEQVLQWIAQHLPVDEILVSVMSQFTPAHHADRHRELTRRLSTYEYNRVLQKLEELGISRGYTQERTSAKEEYTPPFDLSGVERMPCPQKVEE